MDASCPNCGATNRSTSRFCARCGQLLHHDEESATSTAGGGEGALDLPWLQTVQDRALKPKTERLTDAQTIQPPPSAPSPPTDQSQQAGATPVGDGVSSPQAPTSNTPATAEALSPTEPSQPDTPDMGDTQVAPDPNEAPPPWVVSILEPTAASPSGQEQAYEQEELEHIMPWAHGQAEGQGQADKQGSDQSTQANASSLPPWLSDITVQETLQSAGGVRTEGYASTPDLEMEGIEPFVPPVPDDEDRITDSHLVQTQAPEWLRSITKQGDTGQVAGSSQERITSLPLTPTDITSSVDSPLAREIPVRPPRAGSVEVLAGLIGGSGAVAPKPRRIAHDEVHAQVAPGEAVARRSVMSWLLPDGIIYLAIVGVLLAVLLVRPQLGDMSAPTATGVQPFYDAIEAVLKRPDPQDRTVLVAYDWDATRSAEMSILAESVTRHLMARHIRFITVSTNPQGPGFAQQVTARLRDEYPYVYGRDYLVMGYLPGSQAALGALASNFRRNLPVDYEQNRRLDTYTEFTGGSRLNEIKDFALVITLASDEAEMRNWVEQVGARTGVPIVAAVPQGLDPLARPYLNIPNAGLTALISGPTGALQYTKQLQSHGLSIGKAGTLPLSDRLTAQSAAQLLVALVIIAALVKMLTKKMVRR